MDRLQEHSLAEPQDMAGELVLFVGMEPDSVPSFSAGLKQARGEYIPFALLHGALASAPLLRHVASPLMGEQFDAMDMAHELHRAGFTGTYSVFVPSLPRPQMVTQELRQICPGLTVQLLSKAPH